MNGHLPSPGTSTSPDEKRPKRNDCGKMCSPSSSSVHPKVRHFNNLGNDTSCIKVNNTEDSGCPLPNGASTSSQAMPEPDQYMENNVDSANIVDKCPSKVRNGSIEGNVRRNRKQCSFEDDSSSGNEAEEEYCVYTYKGNLQADLPRSLFAWECDAPNADEDGQAQLAQEDNIRSNPGSSPDNDFLEMDFDPGPSQDQDSEEECLVDIEDRLCPAPELPNEQEQVNDLSAANENSECAEYVNNVTDRKDEILPEPQPGPSNARHRPSYRHYFYAPPSQRHEDSSPRCGSIRDSCGYHRFSGDLCSPLDVSEIDCQIENDVRLTCPLDRNYNHFSGLYHWMMAKRLVMNKNETLTDVGVSDAANSIESSPVERTMIWSELEACNKQVTQISTSACGATAILNVMVALKLPFTLDKLKNAVKTRLRKEAAPLPEYLFSRSNAGSTAGDLVRGVHTVSEGRLFARFFSTYPQRGVSISKWLSYWMKKGAVPIATLNLQAGLPPDSVLPDAWHHQMIFGVCPQGIYLTNPLECVPESALLPQLCSPSVIKIKRCDVLQRWTNSTNLRPLTCQTDFRWKRMNVLGQVVNLIRESTSPPTTQRPKTTHISIPAAYIPGITLVIPRNSPAYAELMEHPELPFPAS